MRKLIDSDLFMKEINKDNMILSRANKIISGLEPGAIVLNQYLYPDIKKKVIQARREKVVLEMGKAIENNQMLLFTTPPEKRLQDAFPFIHYKRNIGGSERDEVAVNVSSIVRPMKLPSGEETYEINDVSKIFAVMYSGYLAMSKFAPNAIVDPSVLYDGAVLWAAMFNKPIFDSIGLHNPERNDAFMYFGMRFFLTYMMGCSQGQVDAMAMKFIKKKNDQILVMEEAIEDKQLNIYSGLLSYMKAMFDDEVTQIRGVRTTNIENRMNVSYYINRFIMAFGSNALLGLCTFPYFMFVIIAAYSKCKIVKDKAFDNVFSKYKRELNRLLVNILK